MPRRFDRFNSWSKTVKLGRETCPSIALVKEAVEESGIDPR